VADSRLSVVDLPAAIEAVQRQSSAAAEPDQVSEQVLRLFMELPKSQLDFLGAAVVAAQRELSRRATDVSQQAIENRDGGPVDEPIDDAADGNFRPRYAALSTLGSAAEHSWTEEALREQNAVLQTILESTTDFVYMKDRQGRYVTINSAAAAALGKSVAEIIGRDDHAIFPPDVAREIMARERRILAEGTSESFEETIPLGDQLRHLFTAKSVCRDASGRVIGLVGITRDVTPNVRAEEALREAQRRLAITLKGADVGLWDWDLLTNEVDFSDEWKGQLGYANYEVANNYMEWQSRVHPDDLEQALARVKDAIEKTTSEYRSEFRLRHKDGSWRWILSLGSVIDGPDGKSARMLGVHVDITDRKQTEQALIAGEARYRTFVDHASDALFLQDRSGRIVDVNTQACVSLGYQREELIGMLPFQFDSDVSEQFTDSVLQRLESGETVAFDSSHRRKDGSTFPVEVRLRPFWINDERFHVGLVRDITERKRTEQALRESEARLRTLLENIDKVAVQAYEPDGTITFWNRASEIFYGYSAADALGRDIVDLLHGDATRDAERRIMAEAMRTGKTPPAEELEVLRRDGSKIAIFASRIVHPRPGKSPEFFCFDVDVTERKRAEEELAIRQSELLHASRLTTVGQMVAELSHEVAQPLSAIGNFAAASERILDAESDSNLNALREYIGAIVKQSERCASILERLRDFSRRTSVSRSDCDMSELLRDSVELIASELRSNQVSVRIQVADELPLVSVDRVQLQQVIVNLLTNARDAVRDQAPERRLILVRARTEEDTLVFEVDDHGSGISGQVAARLFDPFFTTKEHGTGIGLSICQSIVKDHGGRIEAFSNSKGGATFRVRLPLREIGNE
jgi:PAS domain S-box-containing protein